MQCEENSLVLTSCVWTISDDREKVLQDISEVGLVETLYSSLLSGDVLQQRVEDVQARVRHIAHGVLECPDDGVQHQLELGWGDV